MDVRYCYQNGSPAAHSSKANKEASLVERIVCFILETSSLLEKAMAPHCSTLAWKTPWTEEHGRLQSMGSWRVRHDWATSLSLFTFMHWRRKWQPTPVFLIPGMGEPGGLPSMGSHRVGHDWSDLAAAAAFRGWGGRLWQTPVHRPTPSHSLTPTDHWWAKAFIGRGRGLHEESTQAALTGILNLVMGWSYKHHLDCFMYSQSSVPGSVCSHFLKPIYVVARV